MSFGLADAWVRLTEEQTRVDEARGLLEARVALRYRGGKSPEDHWRTKQAFWSIAENSLDKTNRYPAGATRQHFGKVLDGLPPNDPSLEGLRFTLQGAYLNPANNSLDLLNVIDTYVRL